MQSIICHVVTSGGAYTHLSMLRWSPLLPTSRCSVFDGAQPLHVIRQEVGQLQLEHAACVVGCECDLLLVVEEGGAFASAEYRLEGNRFIRQYGELPVQFTFAREEWNFDDPHCREFCVIDHQGIPTLVGRNPAYPERWHWSGGPRFLVEREECLSVLERYALSDFHGEHEHDRFEALLARFHVAYPLQPSRVLRVRDGWLAPSGAFYPCLRDDHNMLAWHLSVQWYHELFGEGVLESRGWIRIFGDGFFVARGEHRPLRKEQYRALEQLAGDLAETKRQQWLDEVRRAATRA